MGESVALGIDFGATNIKVAAVDRRGVIDAKAASATNREAPPDAVIDEMVRLVDRVLGDGRWTRKHAIGVGIGAPGPLNPKAGRIVRSANLPQWVDVPLRDRLAERLHLRVVLDNDANAAAFGEFWAGAGRDGGDLVMLTLGTGVGGGAVVGGKLVHGHFGNAAELGHLIVVPDGLPCPCGQHGCLEQYASAAAVARRAVDEARSGPVAPELPARVSENVEPEVSEGAPSFAERVSRGDSIDAELVVQCARAGDPICVGVWNETCLYLGIACVNIQHVFNPARIVLGGGLAQAGDFLIAPVRRAFRARTWRLYDDFPRVETAQLGYDAGVIGAAGLAWSNSNPAEVT